MERNDSERSAVDDRAANLHRRASDHICSETSSKSEKRRGHYLPRTGLVITAVYLIFLCSMAVISGDQLFSLEPNEFGDLLAGAFAPLAFLWLVLGFFQQGEELKASVAALELQGEELRNSVEQQRELVKVSREHMESEVEVLRFEREAAEFAAQPTFVPRGGASYTGEQASFRIGFVNAGADATNVVLRVDERSAVEKRYLAKGDAIETTVSYTSHRDLADISGYISYFDAQGNPRARRFHHLKVEGGGPNGRNSLAPGSIDETLYKPPFPWESKGVDTDEED